MWPLPYDDHWQDRRPRPATSPDIQLTGQVIERILTDPRLDRERITIEVQNGVVNLIGTVTSLHARLTAAEIARTTPGVLDICNRLELARTADVTATMEQIRVDPFDELVAHWDEPRRPATSPGRVRMLKGAAVMLATIAGLMWFTLLPHVGSPGAVLIAVPWLAVAAALAIQSGL